MRTNKNWKYVTNSKLVELEFDDVNDNTYYVSFGDKEYMVKSKVFKIMSGMKETVRVKSDKPGKVIKK